MSEIGGPGPEVVSIQPPATEISSNISSLEKKVQEARQAEGAKKVALEDQAQEVPGQAEQAGGNQNPQEAVSKEVEDMAAKTEAEIPEERRGEYHRILGKLADEKRAKGEPIEWDKLEAEAKNTFQEQAKTIQAENVKTENEQITFLKSKVEELTGENQQMKELMAEMIKWMQENDPKKRETLMMKILKVAVIVLGAAVISTTKELSTQT